MAYPYKLSIVALVYNLQDYLPRCLDALVGQTLQEIEILINDAYRMLQTEEKRKKYDDFLVEVEKIKEKKTEPKMTLEEYEQKKKEHEQIQKRMQERVRNFMKETQSKRLNEDGIKFTPIYKGEINRTPKKDREEDEAR